MILPMPSASNTLSMYTALPQVMQELAGSAPDGFKQQNTTLDWLFYDVGRLTELELHHLVTQTHREGSIIVVWPGGTDRDPAIQKYDDYHSLRAAPGRLLQRFAIAGVGSTDLGAVAFARTLADHCGEPVGAIVAGYGVADLMSEALGGWLVFGGANRFMRWRHSVEDKAKSMADALRAGRAVSTPGTRSAPGRPAVVDDSEALLHLLADPDRQVLWLAGHSKGCLSIAYAMEALVRTGFEEAIEKARRARITTAGAVVQFPRGFDNIGQYLGLLDGFGAINSRIGIDFHPWPGAWHHLNTAIPAHMAFAEVLQREAEFAA